ncbi:class II glutamine amidotransferase [Cryomorphaceae bacterium]|nr:class II glutamine amidotransferase [Cryomorphaceae bacterium]
MSDPIKHECGIALLRLRKPLEYYVEKYGTAFYGLNKMYLLMEKQHNRGQDGAGLANVKLDVPAGKRYISRHRSIKPQPIQDIFKKINRRFNEAFTEEPGRKKDVQWLKENLPFSGELFLAHLRYGTYGKNSIEACHPFLRQNNWMTRNLILAGNFNMTNVDELFDELVALGQHPKKKADTVTILEKIGHFIDEQNDELYYKFKEELGITKQEATKLIAEHMDLQEILQRASKKWDGGYAMAGLVGHGDAFVLRDPAGIRPTYWYADDEIVVAASERPVIMTAFNVPFESVSELDPGCALIVKKDGSYDVKRVKDAVERKACSFERIYFSRGSDAEIYRERIELGRRVCGAVAEAIDGDLDNSVFSFIPNTAETAFYGMVKGMEDFLKEEKKQILRERGSELSESEMEALIDRRPRVEKIAIKDAKLRTFITDDDSRDDLVAHVYDVTYGTVRPDDNLVILDDSIVRGTTLKQSILRILDRLHPKKIVVVSSAPQIRYPDCYGIDMAKLGDFVAFRAAIELLKDTGQEGLVQEVYQQCLAQTELPDNEVVNYVKRIYEPFTAEQISDKIGELLRPKEIKAEVEIIYQGIEDLHAACPKNLGDWYFTGDYPTPGGNRVVNRAFINYVEGNNKRAY